MEAIMVDEQEKTESAGDENKTAKLESSAPSQAITAETTDRLYASLKAISEGADMIRSAIERKTVAEKSSRMARRFLNLKNAACIPYDPWIKSIMMRQNLPNEHRGDCAFIEHLDTMIQNNFSNSVPNVIKGRNENKDTINPEIPLSSQTYTSDRRYVILHAGELENNIVNKKSQAQGKTLYES